MNVEFYNSIVDRVKILSRSRPTWLLWAGLALVILIYYWLVVTPLGNAVNRLQNQIGSDKEQISWIQKAGPEVLRLRQTAPHHQQAITGPLFGVINQTINQANLTNSVSDAHQIDNNHVEISFSSINYNDLMTWLQKLHEQYNINVSEAALQKTGPGLVQATLTLQRDIQKASSAPASTTTTKKHR